MIPMIIKDDDRNACMIQGQYLAHDAIEIEREDAKKLSIISSLFDDSYVLYYIYIYIFCCLTDII